jgi:hypothetical protein
MERFISLKMSSPTPVVGAKLPLPHVELAKSLDIVRGLPRLLNRLSALFFEQC